jgi:hypothetical protein
MTTTRLEAPLLEALAATDPVRAAELRPPRAGLPREASVDAWIELHHGVRRLLDDGRFVLFTDDAVGDREEESLRMLTSSLGPGADLSRVVPFLTCKHTLEYCLLFARRAFSHGIRALTVTGGDGQVGPPRCLPRSRDLRARIRRQAPGLALGAWVNPFRDPAEQVELLLDPEHHADYYLTQVVSHHDLAPLDRFLEEGARRGLELPGMVGVFCYRSARPRTLERLARFLPVPIRELQEEFARGAGPDQVLGRTLDALARRGVRHTYLSNLRERRAAAAIRRVEALMEAQGADCTDGPLWP